VRDGRFERAVGVHEATHSSMASAQLGLPGGAVQARLARELLVQYPALCGFQGVARAVLEEPVRTGWVALRDSALTITHPNARKRCHALRRRLVGRNARRPSSYLPASYADMYYY
jgi:hypothetical protein